MRTDWREIGHSRRRLPMRTTSPDLSVSSAVRISGIRVSRSSRFVVRPSSITNAISRSRSRCWYCRFLSTVIKDLKSRFFRGSQKLTVGHALKAGVAACLAMMTGYSAAQCLVNALVKEDAHLTAGEQGLFRFLDGV